MWQPQLFASFLGPTCRTVLDGVLLLGLFFLGLAFTLRAGISLRVMSLVVGLGRFVPSSLFVLRGEQSGQPWLWVLGVLLALAGVWYCWPTHRGRH